jgi:hypothetical protein
LLAVALALDALAVASLAKIARIDA